MRTAPILGTYAMKAEFERKSSTGRHDPDPVSATIRPLLIRIAANDAAAFKDLYDALAPRLFATAFHILRSRRDAESALKEAMLKVWRDPCRYLGADPLASLIAVVRNTALDLVSPDTRPDPIVAIGRMPEVCGGIGPRQAEAMVAMYRYGLTPEELGRHMGVSPSMAMTLAHEGATAIAEKQARAGSSRPAPCQEPG